MTTTEPALARRHCLQALNALHSTLYFAEDLAAELAPHGVTDPTAVYLAGRFAPLGAVGPGAVLAAANAYAPAAVARHLPQMWEHVSPGEVLRARLRAAHTVLERLLGTEALTGDAVRAAAGRAVRAARACPHPARPLAAANLDAGFPDEPHLALWQAATVLREYRGDGHVVALAHAELIGLDALVLDAATPDGMPEAVVREKRGWTRAEWLAAGERLVGRGLLDTAGQLTVAGASVRAAIEDETDRLDALPYLELGPDETDRLTSDVAGLVTRAATAFPAELRAIFVPAWISQHDDSLSWS